MTGRVLLTDGQPRMTLAAVRSLGSKGLEVMAAEKTHLAPALFSKYCSRRLVYPDPIRYEEDFLQWLEDTLRRYPCDMLFPVDDVVLSIVMRHKTVLEKFCRLPLPPPESYRIAADKALAVKAARKAGLSCPETFCPQNEEELRDTAENVSFPMVIKPRMSSGSRGLRFVENRQQLLDGCRRVHAEYPFPLIQEYIPTKETHSVCLLCGRNSHVKAAYVQKQLRHYPVRMGTSVVQESVSRPDLVEMAISFVQELKWYGVCELEFVTAACGRIFFMEINPRFWGSLHLSILAGVDFPWLLYRLVTEGDVEEVFTYKTGLRCRWLLPGDILHFLTNKERNRMDPPFWAGKKHNVHDDILSRNDPLPALGFALACLRYLCDRKMWKFLMKR